MYIITKFDFTIYRDGARPELGNVYKLIMFARSNNNVLRTYEMLWVFQVAIVRTECGFGSHLSCRENRSQAGKEALVGKPPSVRLGYKSLLVYEVFTHFCFRFAGCLV